MSYLTALISRVEEANPALAKELSEQVRKLADRRDFGLNFERHIPECVELPGRVVRRGDKVRFRDPSETQTGLWRVTRVRRDGVARCAELIHLQTREKATANVESLRVIAEFPDPVFLGLRSRGVEARGGDRPYHVVINGENYHALEGLRFSIEGCVDAIYIDPPYNSGARDWKYNNDYVDGEDAYRHSKWLAFIERRLKLASLLLNPSGSVLIVTIDEKEVHRLGLLLMQTFSGHKVQMVTSVVNPKGVVRANEFSRTDEYIFFVFIGSVRLSPESDGPGGQLVRWQPLRRSDITSARGTKKGGIAQFYPIYVNKQSNRIEAVGDALPHGTDRATTPDMEGCETVFPIRPDGTEMNWGVTAPKLRRLVEKGFVKAGSYSPEKPQVYRMFYLTQGRIKDIESGRAVVEGYGEDGSVTARYAETESIQKLPTTSWHRPSHNAQTCGTALLARLIPGRAFPFPKSLYAVEDVLRLFVKDKPGALILDFFAGSGTTAHAVARLNREDGGRRRSIIVTNNEVGEEEAKSLRSKGLRAGDPDWEKAGIFENVTMPRLRAALTGVTPDGEPVEGDYRFNEQFPILEGLDENFEFFDLTYEDPHRIEHGLEFEALAALLWIRSGAQGRRIDKPTSDFDVADTYGVLFDIDAAQRFVEAVEKAPTVQWAYIITDSEAQYQLVVASLPDRVRPVRLFDAYMRSMTRTIGV
jgi:adenine-specific DNA-methyltransferase